MVSSLMDACGFGSIPVDIAFNLFSGCQIQQCLINASMKINLVSDNDFSTGIDLMILFKSGGAFTVNVTMGAIAFMLFLTS